MALAARVRLAELRRAARGYVRRGWVVAPGAFPAGGEMVCGDPGCVTSGPHLVGHETWPVCDVDGVERVWSRWPYSVAAPTGDRVQVAQVTGWLGSRAFARLEANRCGRTGPVARGPGGDWWFVMRPGEGEWSGWPESHVVLHAAGSWVLLPPSRTVAGRVRWLVPPRGELSTCLPDADVVLGALARELRAVHLAERWPRWPR